MESAKLYILRVLKNLYTKFPLTQKVTMKKYKSSAQTINKIETTSEIISSRGGLLPVMRYIENSGFLNIVQDTLAWTKLNKKGGPVQDTVKQVMAFMIDGTSSSLSYFNTLKNDPTWATLLETQSSKIASSQSITRFFKKFSYPQTKHLRKILNRLFIARLKREQPKVIVLDIDTMVLNNDGAKKRQGVKYSYKKVCGFQPLQVTWNGILIDALFRNGSAHSNHGTDVQKILKNIVTQIRTQYDATIPIVLTTDSGFMSQENFKYYMETLGIFFCCNGKMYDSVKAQGDPILKESTVEYNHGNALWAYCEFKSKLDSWSIDPLRTVYTKCVCDSSGQYLTEACTLSSVIYTNIEEDNDVLDMGDIESIIALAHSRGKSELVNRSFKEFMGTERFPFKRFGMNAAWYFFQAIGHSLYECFKNDILIPQAIPIVKGSYPNTFRRLFIDCGMKFVSHSGVLIAKVHESVASRLHLKSIWNMCNSTPPFLLI